MVTSYMHETCCRSEDATICISIKDVPLPPVIGTAHFFAKTGQDPETEWERNHPQRGGGVTAMVLPETLHFLNNLLLDSRNIQDLRVRAVSGWRDVFDLIIPESPTFQIGSEVLSKAWACGPHLTWSLWSEDTVWEERMEDNFEIARKTPDPRWGFGITGDAMLSFEGRHEIISDYWIRPRGQDLFLGIRSPMLDLMGDGKWRMMVRTLGVRNLLEMEGSGFHQEEVECLAYTPFNYHCPVSKISWMWSPDLGEEIAWKIPVPSGLEW